jgi:arsenite-transporting ATPase
VVIEGADLDPAGWLTRFILFTGKGGVGKTTTAAALAVALADADRRILIVSTDPASNLSGVFTTEVGNRPTPVPGAAALCGGGGQGDAILLRVRT